MIFKLKAHYFGRTVKVIADDNWQDVLKKYEKFTDIEHFQAGFFVTKKGEWIICFPQHPTIGEIVHEVNHMVNNLFMYIDYVAERHNDEIQCYMLGHFCQEIFKKIYNK